ncbi:MAG TPA: outer membrane beta-barrel protein [Terriglobales bacterium]|nr:outer membrane beta-barrel protein [Terriglobales bacterium]
MTTRTKLNSLAMFCLAVLLSTNATAQVTDHLNISAGAGFTDPTGRAGRNLNTGWNLDFRGGFNASRHFLLDLDFNYNYWGLNSAALARVGEPGGNSSIWSLSFDPVYRLAPDHKLDPYVLGGPGLYRWNLSLTRPGTVSTLVCDPFFGFCFPAVVGVTQVVASNTSYKLGANVGAGLEVSLGDRRLKAFAEARYSKMFTTHGSDLEFVPVTFGLRW